MNAGMEEVLHKPVEALLLKNFIELYNLPYINYKIENQEGSSDTESLDFDNEPSIVKNEIYEDEINLVFYEENWYLTYKNLHN